ncbi:MAG: Ig-like domain-containing protein [Terracidiphilus sp.]|jgi:uncharacterized protein YjdB
MSARNCFKVLGLFCMVLPFTGCTNTQVGSIQVSPASQSLVVGQTVQFTATGTIGHGSHPTSSTNVTDQVTWASSAPAVATVSSSGLATAVGAGSTTITASMTGSIAATATLTVTATGGGTAGGSLVSLAIIPGTQSVASPTQTSQFIAIGTTSSGATEDLTSKVTWGSSSAQVATITPAGLATAVSQGTTTITAIGTNPGSTVVTAQATLTVLGGASEPLTKLSITPSSQSVSASGQTGQFIALGTSGTTGLDEDVTGSASLTWSSSIPSVATVNAAGVVTGVSAGSSTITALWTNPDASIVTATASVTVTSTAPPEPLLSLTIIPNIITVGNLQDTGNFLAIGTFASAPYVRDLTNSVTWLSAEPNVFPVSSDSTTVNPGAPGGVVTAFGSGTAVIIAEATAADGTIQTATSTFSCPYLLPAPPQPGSCFPGSEASALLSTVTIYNEGLNTSNWEVTAPSATGTPNVIHCGPGWTLGGGTGGSVCVGTYPIGTPLKLTATQPAGSTGTFGGWSQNCTPDPNPPTANGPNTCIITPTTFNESVGAIFN